MYVNIKFGIIYEISWMMLRSLNFIITILPLRANITDGSVSKLYWHIDAWTEWQIYCWWHFHLISRTKIYKCWKNSLTYICVSRPQCTKPLRAIDLSNKSHNASDKYPTIHQFCNRNVHTCAHFCYKMLHCGTWHRCILGWICEMGLIVWRDVDMYLCILSFLRIKNLQFFNIRINGACEVSACSVYNIWRCQGNARILGIKLMIPILN